jgi:hypothetical protein
MSKKLKMAFNVFALMAMLHPVASCGDEPVLRNSFWGVAAKAAGVSATDLYGMAMQETGMRWKDGTFRPWPWTLMLNGPAARCIRYSGKEEMARALASFISRGITNIDIGLMQVNWKYNGHRYVKSATALVDPRTNVIVATHVLKGTMKATPTKRQGIGHYHSWTAWRSDDYSAKVSRYSERLAYGNK